MNARRWDYDVVIIGAGHTGRAAAQPLLSSALDLNWVVFGTDEPPADLPNDRYRREKVTTNFAMGDHFVLGIGQDTVTTGVVILATGVERVPPLPGEREYYGRGISYCAECDGSLYRGKRVAVIPDGNSHSAEIKLLKSLADVTVYGASADIGNPDRSVTEIIGGRTVEAVRTADGSTTAVDGVFVLKNQLAAHLLTPGIHTNSDELVVVDSEGRSNLTGCFAAGSCARTTEGARVDATVAAKAALTHHLNIRSTATS